MGIFGSRVQLRIGKTPLLFRYPRSEPNSVTRAFPRQIKLTCGRRTKRLHQFPACGGWGSGRRGHTYRRLFKPMASSVRLPGSAETDRVSEDDVNLLSSPMTRPLRQRPL
jgi:hypothetical protein